MDNPIIKILRFLVFLPICFCTMAIVDWFFFKIVTWAAYLVDYSMFWFIVVIFLLGNAIWILFNFLAYLLILVATYISPIKWLGTLTISIVALINGGKIVYMLWNMDHSKYEGAGFVKFITIILAIELTFVLIRGALVANAADSNEENY